MALVPIPELEFVPGRPNVYGVHYPAVNGWYIGRNDAGVLDYMGSPDREARKRIADTHEAIGIRPEDLVREKHILWSPPDATIANCHDQEWIWIAKFRAHHGGPVFNVFPIEDWSNHFEWVHDPVTHVDRATNSRWPVVYLKLQATRDANGNCSGGKENRYGRECGQPWGIQSQELYWCKVVHPDGREQWLCEPGQSRTRPYTAFRDHKFAMINDV